MSYSSGHTAHFNDFEIGPRAERGANHGKNKIQLSIHLAAGCGEWSGGAVQTVLHGYLNPGASGYGYISTLKLSTGAVRTVGLDPGTEGIVSYDRCEKNDAYIGQINVLTASSFCGANGAVWGYHLVVADEIAGGRLKPIYYENEPEGRRIRCIPSRRC